MRLLRALLLIVVGWAATTDRATAGARAEVRGRAVWLDGTLAWRGAVTSPLVWSRAGEAVAFAGRDSAGRAALVVVVAGVRPTVLTWPIPRSAQPARAVTWLGPTRIGAGPTELDPRIVASYSIER